MTTIYFYIKLLRPLNVMTGAAAMLIATAILDEFSNVRIMLLLSFIVMMYTAASNALNDAIDHEVDLINRPMRPIPSGYVTVNGALYLSFILFTIGSVLCIQLPDSAIVIGVFLAVPLMIVYSTHLKGRGLIGNLVVALMLGMAFLFAGAAYGNIEPMWIPMLLAFGLTLVRELVKDIADIEGDQFSGLHTFPIVFGMNRSIQLVIVLCVLIGLCSFIPYIKGVYDQGYVVPLIIGVEIPLMIVTFILINNPSISSAIYSARILKFSTLMGLFSIYSGTT